MELETFTLCSGGYFCRPLDSMGSVGFFPFPWTMAWGPTEQAARSNFRELHANQLQRTLKSTSKEGMRASTYAILQMQRAGE